MLIYRFIFTIIIIFPLFNCFSLKAQDLFSEPPSPSSSTTETTTQTEPDTDTKTETEKSPPKLKIGFAGEEPSVVVSETGEVTGITVEIWEKMAQELELDYEIVLYSSVPEALVHLGVGKINVAFGTISVTPERLELFDFTQPLAQDDLTLLLPPSPPTLWSVIRPFLGWAFISSIAIIYLILFIVGNLLWLAEHKENPQQFPPKYSLGIREGMWCAVTTFTTVGYGDRYPITRLGRGIAGWWAIISTVLLTTLTAGISTTLTLAFSRHSVEEFRKPQDLKNARIAVITGSSAAKWAEYYQARLIPVKDLDSGIDQLENQQVDAILYARFFLENYLNQNPQSNYRIANFSLGTENYSIALTLDSPLTDKLNEQLLNIDMQIQFKKIADNWFQINDN